MPRPHPTGSALTWLGHSTMSLSLDGTSVLTDPLLRRRVAHLVRGADVVVDDPPDVILCSHAHRDHLDIPSLRTLPRTALVVVPRGCGRRIRQLGFDSVAEVRAGDELRAGAIRITATHAEHSPGRGLRHSGPAAVGYLVAGSVTVYFAGDTDLFGGMTELAPGLDVALLPVSGWGPRLPAGHLSPQLAVDALRLLQPRIAVPIHWSTYRPFYRRTPYPDDADAGHRFASLARESVPSVEVRVLETGVRSEI